MFRRWFRRRTAITREGMYYLFVLAFVLSGAVLREINLMLVLAGMMVGPLWFNWRAVRGALRGLRIERHAPAVVTAGNTLTVELSAASAKTGYAIVVEDAVRPCKAVGGGAGLVAPAVLFSRVQAGHVERGGYQLRFERRGAYAFGPLRAVTRFPFGLVRRAVTIEQPRSLLVLPRLGRLAPRWRKLCEAAAFESRIARRSQPSAIGDFYALRDWRPGDSRRLIHWRTTARRGAMMVRQFEPPRKERLTLLVDLWQPDRAGPDHLRAVELAVSFAATVVDDFCRRGGSHLLLAIAGVEPVRLEGVAGLPMARQAQRHLALAEAHSASGGEQSLRQMAERSPTDSRLVLVTTRATEAADRDGIPAAGQESSSAARSRRNGPRTIARLSAAGDELSAYFTLD